MKLKLVENLPAEALDLDIDTSILTDEIISEMVRAEADALGFETLLDGIVVATKEVDKKEPLITKLLAIARQNFMFGYYTALEHYQEIQQAGTHKPQEKGPGE